MTETQVQEQAKRRYRSPDEKTLLHATIAKYRLNGVSFLSIAGSMGLSERQVRRHYREYISIQSTEVRKDKTLIGALFLQYQHSLDQSSLQLSRALEEGDSAKILQWQRMRQECLRDYTAFLKDAGLQSALVEISMPPNPLEGIMKRYSKTEVQK